MSELGNEQMNEERRTIPVSIIGGAGYTGGELIRLLLNHPHVELVSVHSRSQQGKKLYEVHPDLLGETALTFSDQMPEDIKAVFLCLPHGESAPYLGNNVFGPEVLIVDLSRDFRMKGNHKFVYGLPELSRDAIRETQYLANPGCFATAIQLAFLPLAAAGELKGSLHVHALTGSTGAGQKPGATTHFSWRNNNVSVYKAFSHQHEGEIGQSLQQLQESYDPAQLNFLPVRGNFARGIFASAYLETDLSEEAAIQLYADYYNAHPFVHLSSANPDMKSIVNTNKCVLHISKHEGKLLIISMIDNLLKGASGQAVQNFNLMMGWEETMGLKLKGIGF